MLDACGSILLPQMLVRAESEVQDRVPKQSMGVSRCFFPLFVSAGLMLEANAADVLFYGWGKGKNFQQITAASTVNDAVDPWEATSFVWLSPGTGALTGGYFGTTANPMLYSMNDGGDHWQIGDSETSQAAIDAAVPNGTYRITMQTVHDGTKAANLALSGNNYPNIPTATNFTAMQSVNPAANFTVYWNAFTSGTTNDVIIASLVANQFASYDSITNSPLPGQSGTLNGKSRSWTIPSSLLSPNSTQYVRVVFYKVVSTNKTAYAGVTGFAVYATGTTIPLVTTAAPPPPPTIVASPTNQTVYVGNNVLMSVTATGSALNYQWRRSNTNLAGATLALYSIPNAQTNHSGNYTVVVTNLGGATTSSVAVLTVLLPPKPVISQQPTNLTVTVGSTAKFYLVATGVNLAYQWQRAGTNVPGATGSLLSLPNVQPADAGSYTVVVTNLGGSVTSSPALLTVVPLSSPQLNITVTGGSASLSWPLAAAAFQLQAGVAVEGSFTNHPGVPVTNGNSLSVTVPVSLKQEFFRLKSP